MEEEIELEGYLEQLKDVEAALRENPNDSESLALKEELEEIIEVSRAGI